MERHAIVSVCNLSDDLLLHIFHLNVDVPFNDWYKFKHDDEDITRQSRTYSHAHRTTRFTSQVCHRWRHLALGYPLLWGYVFLDMQNLKWGLELLRRSGNCPIDLRCLDRKVLKEYVTPALVSRVRSYGGILSEEIWHYLLQELQKPFSSLQAIQCHPYIDTMQLPFKFIPTHRDTSPLKSLSVRAFNGFDFSLPLFSSLSILVIYGCPGPKYPINELLRVLLNMPLMENLSLRNVLKSASSRAPLPHINLPLLQYFNLVGPFREVLTFSNHVCVPTSCALDFAVGVNSAATTYNFEALVSRVSRKILRDQVFIGKRALTISITNAYVSINDVPLGVYRSESYNIYDREDRANELIRHSNLRIQSAGVPKFPWRSYLSFLKPFLEAISNSVTSLYLDFHGLVQCVDRRALPLDRFKSMTCLSVNSPKTLKAVLPFIHCFSDDGQIVFPALNQIRIVFNDGYFYLSSAKFAELVAFLKWRATVNAAIHTVELIQPWNAPGRLNMLRTQLTTLKNLVSSVELFYLVDHVLLRTDFNPVIVNDSMIDMFRSNGGKYRLKSPPDDWDWAYPKSNDELLRYSLYLSSLN